MVADNKKQLLLIQSLRGIAALLVLVHHGAGVGNKYLDYKYSNNIFSAGWIGVDFFFVLSGFIIFYVHYNDIGQKKKLKPFYLKRFLRVYPIYWVMTIVLSALFFIVPSWGIGYETNIDVIIKSMLLFPQAHDPIVNVGWTLVHEIFFYLMFSTLIYFRARYSSVIATVWIIGILLNAIGIVDLKGNFYLNFIFNNYNLEFIFGCVVGYLVLKSSSIRYKSGILLSGTVGLIISWYLLLQGVLQRYHTESMLALGISCTLIVLAAAYTDLNSNLKMPKPLLLLGDASYSIYLTHFYVFVFLFKVLKKIEHINPFNKFITVSLSLVIVTVLGVLFHITIEKPLLKHLNRKLLRRVKPIQENLPKKVI